MSFEDFKARLFAAGFRPDEQALREMYAALPHLEAMCERVRRAYGHADEPAHIFDAAAEGRK